MSNIWNLSIELKKVNLLKWDIIEKQRNNVIGSIYTYEDGFSLYVDRRKWGLHPTWDNVLEKLQELFPRHEIIV